MVTSAMLNRIAACLVVWLCCGFWANDGLATPVQHHSSKTLVVRLDSQFGSGGLVHEAAEFYWDIDSSMFWGFIDDTASTLAEATGGSDSSAYDGILADCLDNLPFDGICHTLSSSLAIHTYSPKLETFGSLRSAFLDENQSLALQLQACPALTVYPSGTASCGLSVKQLEESTFVPDSGPRFDVFPFDHVYDISGLQGNNTPTVVIYGDLSSSSFFESHAEAVSLSKEGRIRYVLRLAACTTAASTFNVQGFGILVVYKNMEYNVLDDQKFPSEDIYDDKDVAGDLGGADRCISGFCFETLRHRFPEFREKLDDAERTEASQHRQLLEVESSSKVAVWEMSDLGAQSVQSILGAADPLYRLRHLAEDFPIHAHRLKKIRLDNTVTDDLRLQRQHLNPGSSILLVNSIEVAVKEMDVYAFQKVLSSEAATYHRISSLGVSRADISSLLRIASPAIEETQFRLDTRDQVITFFNDIEKDKKYRHWPSHLSSLLEAAWPGQIRLIRRNVYTLVAVVDPSSRIGLSLISRIRAFVELKAPVQAGLVFDVASCLDDPVASAVDGEWFSDESWASFKVKAKEAAGTTHTHTTRINNDMASLVSRAFRHLAISRGRKRAFDFLARLHESLSHRDGTTHVNTEDTEAAFCSQYKNEQRARQIFSSISSSVDGFSHSEFIQDSISYVQSRGLAKGPHIFLNGAKVDLPSPVSSLDDTSFTQLLIRSAFPFQTKLQRDLAAGILSESDSVSSYLFDADDVFDSLHDTVLDSPGSLRYVPMVMRSFPELSYVSSPAASHRDTPLPLSLWLLSDWSNAQHLDLALSAVRHIRRSSYSRLAFVFFSIDGPQLRAAAVLRRLLRDLNSTASVDAANEILDAVECLLHIVHAILLCPETQRAPLLDTSFASIPSRSPLYNAVLATSQEYDQWSELVSACGVSAGEAAIVINGRIVRALPGSPLVDTHFGLLERIELKRVSGSVHAILQHRPNVTSTSLSSISHTLGIRLKSYRVSDLDLADLDVLSTSLHYQSDSIFHVVAVVDPLSLEAQRLAPVMVAVRDVFKGDLKVYLNPSDSISELPINRFYRYVYQPQIVFDQHGQIVEAMAEFRSSLPSKDVLTLGIETPDHWLVEATKVDFDMDNIILEELGPRTTVRIEFGLSHILIAGSCQDDSRNEPPAGLTLVLDTLSIPHMQDTVVMANLGYFQLKASPGVFQLGIAPGRAQNIYSLAPLSEQIGDIYTMVEKPGALSIAIVSFVQVHQMIVVRRNPGTDSMSLVEEDSGDDRVNESPTDSVGFWGTISKSLFGSDLAKDTNSPPTRVSVPGSRSIDNEGCIHIFSLASGHLYERFLRIMMLSVRKTTPAHMDVKFWFVRQFLSPQFKNSIQEMATKHGFFVELVTYKWPSWLRQQTEKQRIIWGYKILFLDVLFPLGLRRVIFIDADQIVRSDLTELWTLDLHGKPYAYTPFCDSNSKTEGFRFWKTGFWKEHLRGLPYHISALYVVDLKQFRRMRAGDTLRAIYDNLSRDPNSLANLDQDLPNYAQHLIPIYSLPQEWLWCEAWCSMQSLRNAKTIDLCNNPMTKEPKLTKARRLVEEWSSLDQEANSVNGENPASETQEDGQASQDINAAAVAASEEFEEARDL